MVWLLILFVALFVIAPVFWIMPTPAQRRQERMRARARTLGLEVVGCELPQTRRQRVRGEPRRLGMLYRAPFPREGESLQPKGESLQPKEESLQGEGENLLRRVESHQRKVESHQREGEGFRPSAESRQSGTGPERRLRGGGPEEGATARWLRERDGEWEMDEAVPSTSTALPPDGLPATAVGYEITRSGVGLYWREGGDEGAVEAVATVLLRERDRLLGR